MFCPKCGTQNADESKFCSNCGGGLVQAVPSPQPVQGQPQYIQESREKTHTSGMAVAALVMGIVGFLINPLCILAIIFGGVALGQTNRNPDLGGRGMAIAGLVLGIIVVALWIIAIIAMGSIVGIFGHML